MPGAGLQRPSGGLPVSFCATFFTAAGNTLQITNSGFRCGHEPVHTSTSGTCVHIDDTQDVFFCHHCHVGGGPVEALMSLMGVSRADAEAHIQAQGGRVSRSRTGSKESL